MHTHLTKVEGPGTFRTRNKISGPHFVAGLLIVPRSYDQVDEIVRVIC